MELLMYKVVSQSGFDRHKMKVVLQFSEPQKLKICLTD